MAKKKNSKSQKSKKQTLTTFGKIWRIALCIAVPLGGGFIISLLTRNTMEKFGNLNQPPLAPPAWLFPVAWTILYVLMGLAVYFIYLKLITSNKQEKTLARGGIIIYTIQLALNFIWTPVFFNAGLYWVAFAVLVVMWILEFALVFIAFKISKPAFWCLLPYILWTSFAAYLNISIALIN